MKIHFSADGWDDYQHWARTDPDLLRRLNALIADVGRQSFVGLGKPEPLRGDLSGWWSRRITGQHRLVYRVQGKPGPDRRIEVIQCRSHY